MIPRRLFQVWVGAEPLPVQFGVWRARWLDLHPGWEHILVTDANRPVPLRNEDLFERAETLAPGHAGQFRADLLRYELLADMGGVYADLDTEPLRPLDPLLDVAEQNRYSAFVGWEMQWVWANNAVMGGSASSLFLEHLVAGVHDSVAAATPLGAGARPNVMTGPRYLTPVLRQHLADVLVLDQGVFYPYGFADVGTVRERGPWPEETWVVHHWNNRRSGRRGRRRAARMTRMATRARRVR